MAYDIKDWSTTPASNDSADSGINWAEGQPPSSVNNSARGMMAAIKSWWDQSLGGVNHAATDTGTANAYAIAPLPAITAYGTGQCFWFFAINANTGASTLAVNGLVAKAIERRGNPLTGTEIGAGDLVSVVYDGTAFQMINALSSEIFESLVVNGDLTVDTNTLHVDSTGNNVGVGTAAPSAKLDVAGGAKVSGDFSVDGTTLHVDTTNNRVGIGTSSPSQNLHNTGTSQLTGELTLGAGWQSNYNSGGLRYGVAVGGRSYIAPRNAGDTDWSWTSEFGYDPAATKWYCEGDFTVDTTSLHVDSTNNRVGIGTTSPGNNLHVVGNRIMHSEGAVYSQLFSHSATSRGYVGTQSGHPFSIRTSDIDAIQIDASGDVTLVAGNDLTVDTNTLHVDATNNRVGIGTTSPALPLQVNGTAGANNFLTFQNGNATTPAFRRNSDTNTGMYFAPPDVLGFATGGVEGLKIDASQNVTIANGNLTVDTDTLHVDAANDRIGIGTTSTSKTISVSGPNGTGDGPNISFKTSLDSYPLLETLNYTHDNITICFDCYYAVGWKSSDAGSNYSIHKGSDLFTIRYDSGIAAGGAITWKSGLSLDTSGNVDIPTGDLEIGGNKVLPVSSLTELGANSFVTDADYVLVYDGSSATHKKTPLSKFGQTVKSSDAAQTFAMNDANTLQVNTGATARTWTVPPNSSVAYEVGTTIGLSQTGTGQVTIAAGAGVTIRSPNGLKLSGQGSYAALIKVATDTWILNGDLTT